MSVHVSVVSVPGTARRRPSRCRWPLCRLRRCANLKRAISKPIKPESSRDQAESNAANACPCRIHRTCTCMDCAIACAPKRGAVCVRGRTETPLRSDERRSTTLSKSPRAEVSSQIRPPPLLGSRNLELHGPSSIVHGTEADTVAASGSSLAASLVRPDGFLPAVWLPQHAWTRASSGVGGKRPGSRWCRRDSL